jgi:release factor glutamine methyltransferase
LILTVLEAIKLATDYFEKKQIESPRVNAEILLADILKCKRLDLYLKFDQPLKDYEVDKYREYIARRGKYEPVQYITGSAEFYGLNFSVDKSVLIPRPETEILVETIINQFKDKETISILDIGTGSGNISISLAKFLAQSHVTSIDISPEAIEKAKYNSTLNGINGNIDFIAQDIFSENYSFDKKFDLIVSNPPYISVEEYPVLQNEIVFFEPKIALTDEGDGLKYYKHISKIARDLLNENGKLFFEIGKGQSNDIRGIMEDNLFEEIEVVKDYQQIDRVISGKMK